MSDFFRAADFPDLLVGLAVPDDAAVWRVSEERALVITADFFTPVVDDPFDYGAIAAANALSDIYAMGGKPFLALNLAAMPAHLPEEMIAAIFRGAAEKVREAGAVIAGGHTIDDEEPKFGLVALGWANPVRLGTKGAAQPGDVLLLTKPLGTGLITTAAKADAADWEHLAAAVEWMKRLNKAAAEALRGGPPPHAVTDITGFGLLGHAWEVAERSGVRLSVHFEALPFIEGARQYAEDLLFPAMAGHNASDYGEHVSFAPALEYEEQMLCFSPETSGGLFLSLPPEEAEAYRARAEAFGQPTWVIGEVLEGPPHIDVV